MRYTGDQLILSSVIANARVNAMMRNFETLTVAVQGINFEVRCYVANRKCFDFMPTPTLMIKADGKRVSEQTAMSAIADREKSAATMEQK